MKLLTHKMAGFNRLTGTFTLDFAALPGLVAITGGNGQGKTSLALEGPLAGLYGPGAATRAFASREGPLARYAKSRAAYIDDTWLVGGVTYRVRVNVDSERRSTDAVLLQVNADGTEVPLNDGKTSTYKDAVTQRFPSQRSLLAGPFAGQSRRGSFGELGQKERMELFVELADLAHLEQRAATCRRCAEKSQAVVDRIKWALQAAATEIDNAEPVFVANRLAEIGTQAQSVRDLRAQAQQLLATAESARDRLQADAQRHAVVSALLETARQDVARAELRLEQLDDRGARTAHAESYRQIDMRRDVTLASIGRRRAELVATYDTAMADRGERIRNNEALLKDKAAIQDAVAAEATGLSDIARYREDEATHRQLQTSAREKLDEARRALAKCDVAAQELADAERRAGLLQTVKFGDECGVPPACPLVTDAVAARERIDRLRLEVAPAQELKEAMGHWTAEMARHGSAMDVAVSAALKATKVVESCRRDVARAPYLDAAEERLAEYRKDQHGAQAAHAKALATLEAESEAAVQARISETRTADDVLLAAQEATETQRLALAAELAGLREAAAAKATEAEATATAPRELQTALAGCQQAQEAMAAAATDLAKLETERTGLEYRQAALAKLHQRHAELTRRRTVAEDALLAWQQLAQRLGRDGLQRLEIDAAGPVVSDLANQLLEVGWGPRFGVAIVTQVATADRKDMKEKFTIEVLDNLHGGDQMDIGDLSGGERVVVEEAIRAALACYVNMRSRQPCRTIWRDEADGGLEHDAGPRYIQMLRKLQDLSGAEQVVFITHKPELAEMADTVVHVRDGQVESVRSVA